MAVYDLDANDVAVHDKTLTPDEVDAVNIAGEPKAVEVLSDGAAAIFVSVDGAPPTVNGANTYKLPAAQCARIIPHGRTPAVVQLISEGAPTYSVARAD